MEIDTLYWGTYDGRKIKLMDLEGEHLKNIIRHIKENLDWFPRAVLALIELVAQSKGIDPDQCVPPTVPFQGSDGKLKTFSRAAKRYIEVPLN